jgi:hypothetical protein
MREHRQPEAAVVALRRLKLDGLPLLGARDLGEPRKEDGLADPAQAGEDHRRLGTTTLEAAEQDPESVEELGSTGEHLGVGARVRSIRIARAVHPAIVLRRGGFIKWG